MVRELLGKCWMHFEIISSDSRLLILTWSYKQCHSNCSDRNNRHERKRWQSRWTTGFGWCWYSVSFGLSANLGTWIGRLPKKDFSSDCTSSDDENYPKNDSKNEYKTHRLYNTAWRWSCDWIEMWSKKWRGSERSHDVWLDFLRSTLFGALSIDRTQMGLRRPSQFEWTNWVRLERDDKLRQWTNHLLMMRL